VAYRYPKRLIVEGSDDLHSVVGLMRAHIDWPQEPKQWPVFIENDSSAEEILADGFLTAKLKASDTMVLGVLFDADTNPAGRYSRFKNRISSLFPALPATIPEEGLIAETGDGKRIGLWIMPDNRQHGDLETFLQLMVPQQADAIWQLSTKSVAEERSIGAPCRDSHVAKAHIYTFLAWHDPPGQHLGMAITKKVLDPHADSAIPFTKWFRALYEL
jgi:hypothetical protein